MLGLTQVSFSTLDASMSYKLISNYTESALLSMIFFCIIFFSDFIYTHLISYQSVHADHLDVGSLVRATDFLHTVAGDLLGVQILIVATLSFTSSGECIRCEANYTPLRFLQLAGTIATLYASTINCILFLYSGIHCLLAFKSIASKYIQNSRGVEPLVAFIQSLARQAYYPKNGC